MNQRGSWQGTAQPAHTPRVLTPPKSIQPIGPTHTQPCCGCSSSCPWGWEVEQALLRDIQEATNSEQCTDLLEGKAASSPPKPGWGCCSSSGTSSWTIAAPTALKSCDQTAQFPRDTGMSSLGKLGAIFSCFVSSAFFSKHSLFAAAV